MDELKLPLTEHLAEFRKRIVISLGSVLLILLFVFNYSEKLFDILTLPLKSIRLDFTNPYIHMKEKLPHLLFFLRLPRHSGCTSRSPL